MSTTDHFQIVRQRGIHVLDERFEPGALEGIEEFSHAQPGKNRPNRIGSTICRILRREGRELYVSELDAIDGTPVLDVKAVLGEFLPREDLRQPDWSHELMRDYWAREE